GTYFYCQHLGFSRFSSLVSAIIVMFSAFFVTRAKHLNMIAVAAWVPFLFYFTKRLFEDLKWRWAFILGTILGIQFLAGHPQMTFFSTFILLLYFVFETWLTGRKRGFPAVIVTSLLSYILILAIGLSLSAVQILPTLELTGQGERTQWTLANATNYPYHPKNLMSFISPYYFGNPATGTYKEPVTEIGVFWENASYLGLLPLILALFLIWQTLRALIPSKSPNPLNSPLSLRSLFFIALALFSLLLMLGRFTPVFSFLWHNFPGFNLFRFPTRFNLFLIFSLAILAGLGAQKLAEKLATLKITRSASSGQAHPSNKTETEEEFHFSWPLNLEQTKGFIIIVILVDLFVFGQAYVGKTNASQFLKEPKAVKILKEDQSLFRLWSVTQYGQSPYQVFGWKKNPESLISIRNGIPPNLNLEYHLPSFSDRGWFEGGLSSRKRNDLERWLLNENHDQITIGKVLGMFNVKYILTFAQEGGFEMKEKASLDLGKEFGLPLKIFENLQVMPRVFYVPEAKVIRDEEAILNEFADSKFLPTRTVILASEPRQIPPSYAGSLDEFQKNNPLTLKKYEATKIILEADIKNHGFLVLSDLYYPGWIVKVDGKEKEILPANYTVRAVELTPGQHTIEFSYSPTSFKIGAGVSGMTLIGLLIIAIFQLKAGRQKTENRRRS
ncbi:MAG: YfhO family protein, partial [bacterium]|nr:YfhO family protein [bacterium]